MRSAGRGAARLGAALAASGVVVLAAPGTVLAHELNASYASRLPLAVYVAGAAMTVALSFVFVLARDVRATAPTMTGPATLPRRPIRLVLRALGLIAWLWIVAQGLFGGSSAGDVATLFLWVYGWVGMALVSALIGPAWHFVIRFPPCTTSVPRCFGGSGYGPGTRPSTRLDWAGGPASSGSPGLSGWNSRWAAADRQSCSSCCSATRPTRSR